MLEFKYTKTAIIKDYLAEIEILRQVYDKLPVLPNFEKNLRRESLLKSSLFSARIEGNPLTERDVYMEPIKDTKDIAKLEIFNLLKAYEYVYFGRTSKNLSLNLIYKLHMTVLKGISSSVGRLRKEPWGIFNQAGVAVYLAPPHTELPQLMREFVRTSKSLLHEVTVNAAITQFLFEKIHPFADGNGRVGRLISAYVLNTGGFGLRGLVSFEEFIDKKRDTYYEVLEPSKNVTPFVEFFLESYVSQANLLLDNIKHRDQELPEDALLPRRREIFLIINDHPLCSFDFIRRRFSKVNPKTLHYDLGVLQKKGFIKKIGKTKGVVYRVGNER